MTKNKEQSRSFRWHSLIAISLTIILLVLALRGLDWSRVISILKTGQISYLILGFIIASISFFSRSVRWWTLLCAEKPIRLIKVFWATMLGYLGNNFLPGRAGELIRTVFISRSEQLSLEFTLATVISERVFDAIFLILISSVAVIFIEGLPEVITKGMIVFGMIAIFILSFLFLLPKIRIYLEVLIFRLPASEGFKGRLILGLSRFLTGLSAIQQPFRAMKFIFLTVVIWFLDAFGCVLVSRSYHLDITLSQSLFFLAVLGISSSLPSTPGYIGVYQFIAVTVLPLYGFTKDEALVFILVIQTLSYITVIFWGLLGIWRFEITWAEVQRTLRRA